MTVVQAPKKTEKVLDEDDLAFKEKQVGGAGSPQASASISPICLVLATSHGHALEVQRWLTTYLQKKEAAELKALKDKGGSTSVTAQYGLGSRSIPIPIPGPLRFPEDRFSRTCSVHRRGVWDGGASPRR
jgi:hypothetical protein